LGPWTLALSEATAQAVGTAQPKER
jgi:hypothetical protein